VQRLEVDAAAARSQARPRRGAAACRQARCGSPLTARVKHFSALSSHRQPPKGVLERERDRLGPHSDEARQLTRGCLCPPGGRARGPCGRHGAAAARQGRRAGRGAAPGGRRGRGRRLARCCAVSGAPRPRPPGACWACLRCLQQPRSSNPGAASPAAPRSPERRGVHAAAASACSHLRAPGTGRGASAAGTLLELGSEHVEMGVGACSLAAPQLRLACARGPLASPGTDQ